MQKLIYIAGIILVIGFISLGIREVTQSRQKIEVQQIELQSRESQLKEVRLEFEQLNIELDNQLNKSNQDKQKIERLKKERQELEQRTKKLEADLRAKKQREADERTSLARAANTVRGTNTVSAAATPSSGSCEAEIRKYNWNVNVALAVSRAESGLRTNAINNNPATRDYSVGCFQINLFGNLRAGRPPEAQLLQAHHNVAYAYRLYQASGGFKQHWRVCDSKVRCY